MPRAAVCLGAQAAAALALVAVPVALVEAPVAVAEADLEEPLEVPVAVPVEVPVAVAVAPVPVEQVTWSGTWTPLALQICWAKVMALAWSSALQAPTRQQETSPMKLWFAQMHLGSVPQPP